MKISYEWLNSLLPEKLSVDQLSTILTSIGLEVEDVVSTSKIPGGLAGIVIGKVLTCAKHENADKLRVTTVDIGNNTVVPIVCGAPNVAAGQTVVVATVGAMLYPTSGEPFEIKKAKIRGEHSEGMICAEDEIGLGTSHDGIIVIDKDVAPGTPASEHYNLAAPDYTFEIGLTPNRMDAMSHMGVAKDICAYLSNKNNKPYIQVVPQASLPSAQHNATITIDVQSEDCKRYAGILLKNVRVCASPEWLVARLQAAGVRSINNVVDITNYILLEVGQPLHAFDATKINGNKIVVRAAQAQEKFTTLDQAELTLAGTELMICDAQQGMCIAGVYGGLTSGVTNTTTDVFLESAWFEPNSIRRTSTKWNLRTEAAIRFEKGVDVSQTRYALERAAQMLCELADAELASEVIDYYPTALRINTVDVRYDYIRKLSGNNYTDAQIKNILLHLCFGIEAETQDQLTLKVPYAKPDISIAADIVEEVMRIDGLDNVPFTGKLSFGLQNKGAQAAGKLLKEKTAQCLTQLGYHELFTNSIGNSAHYGDDTNLVKMLNNLSAELDCMRPSMLESGLQVIQHNLNRKNSDLFLYEIGKVYGQIKGRYFEKEELHLFASGHVETETWQGSGKLVDVFYMKRILSALAQRLGIALVFETQGDQILLKLGKQSIGALQAVAAEHLQRFDIKQEVWHARLEWQAIEKLAAQHKLTYKPVSKFQNARRDLAIVIDAQTQYAQIEKCIKQVQSPLLLNTGIFDVFASEKLGEGKKSYALSFEFGHLERTLTDADIDGEMQKLRNALEKETKASIRS